MVDFSVVAALDKARGIGKGGTLPWRLKGDMAFFRELTSCPDTGLVESRYRFDQAMLEKRIFSWDALVNHLGPAKALPAPSDDARNAVIMGRKTWESLPERYRPLPHRLNVVMSRSGLIEADGETTLGADSFDEALALVHAAAGIRQVFVIGGGAIFAQALAHPSCTRLFLTEIDAEFDCDVFLPPLGDGFEPAQVSPWLSEKGLEYRLRIYLRRS